VAGEHHRADNNSAADNLNRDLDESGENYEEAQRLHRLSSPPGVRTVSKNSGGPADQGDLSFYTCGNAFRKSGTLDTLMCPVRELVFQTAQVSATNYDMTGFISAAHGYREYRLVPLLRCRHC
jgi:hypothetical protein